MLQLANKGKATSDLEFPRWLGDKESTCQTGDVGSIPGEGTSSLLQYSCLVNPMDRGAWWATVHGLTKSQTQLSD